MDKQQVANLIVGEKYHPINDLRYNQKVGIMFSKNEFEQFLATKDELVDEHFEPMKPLPLKTFNSKHCFYVNGLYLLQTQNEYRRLLVSDYELNQSWLFDRNLEISISSRFLSNSQL